MPFAGAGDRTREGILVGKPLPVTSMMVRVNVLLVVPLIW